MRPPPLGSLSSSQPAIRSRTRSQADQRPCPGLPADLPSRGKPASVRKQDQSAPSPLSLTFAFAAKVLLVQSRRLPGWALPAAGGTLAVLAGVMWYTSALWYYNGYQLPGV